MNDLLKVVIICVTIGAAIGGTLFAINLADTRWNDYRTACAQQGGMITYGSTCAFARDK